MQIQILRTQYQDKQTLGKLFIHDDILKIFECHTLELPWRNNERTVSCIPTGIYQCVKHVSPKFGNCVHVLDVPGRSEILIHRGNYYFDTLGCILLGAGLADINSDGYLDVTHSRLMVEKFLSHVPDSFTLEVLGEPFYIM